MAEILGKRADLTDPTPMMAQYLKVKDEYAEFILMYRLGDFYEMFFEDALTASSALDLTLTGRDCGDGRRAAMCGVPFHKLDVYVGKLVEKGYKVSICEQTEDPALAKGLVDRAVVRVVTPGTVTDADILPEGKNNYLAAITLNAPVPAVAFADISTGQVYVTSASDPEDPLRSLEKELAVYSPEEVITDIDLNEYRELAEFLYHKCDAPLPNPRRADLFDEAEAKKNVIELFGEEKASALNTPGLLTAVGAILAYIRETQKVAPTYLRELHVYSCGQFLEMDLSTFRNLELTESMRDKEKKGSLLWVLDKTVTSLGARCLRSWLRQPLCNIAAIRNRQGAVKTLTESFLLRENLRGLMAGVLDIERLTAKVVYGTANARDLRALCESLKPLPEIRQAISDSPSDAIRTLRVDLDPLTDVCRKIDEALADELPLTVREGGMIRPGFDRRVDQLRGAREDGNIYKEEIERQEIAETGIKGLRIGYNRVFGYYIEVPKSQISLVPKTYYRKQTLSNCERYVTDELKDMESRVLRATEHLTALEYEIFCALRDEVAAASERIKKTAAVIAALDVYCSLAQVASESHYVCPEIEPTDILSIRGGRHPVVEKFMRDSYFVPNDTEMDEGDHRLMLITGPNMAGKSTYMRQVALIVLMAQIGSFVPAEEARIGVVDRVFTRVGASDDLASGQSTFMVEMNEVANILHFATRKSLVIFDEVGRGTSTFDGMSIARAVVEYTAKKIGARTLFATHYHELTDLEGICPGVVNYHIAAKKRNDDIIFLRKICPGATDDSYGIEVAKLAGVPAEVVRRAREVLGEMLAGEPVSPPKGVKMPKTPDPAQPDMLTELKNVQAEEVAEALRNADLNTLTPLEAMNLLFELKKKLTVR